MTRLVIGIGNPDRGDDVAGAMVASRIGSVHTESTDDCSGLIDLWEQDDDVVVVDATRSGQAPGTVRRFDALTEPLPARSFSSSHSVGLAETVELARALGRLPHSFTIYGIEGGRFGLGDPVSPEVEDAVLEVARLIEAGGG